MRKEINTILLTFLVVLTLFSFLSYSPADPSVHHVRGLSAGVVHNLFGRFGAHFSGIFIGLFGLGAFWIPVLLMVFTFQYGRGVPGRNLRWTLPGGMLLVVASGTLLSFGGDHYVLFGSRFVAGGMVGAPLKGVLLRYANFTGGVATLLLLLSIGLILATGFSFSEAFAGVRVIGGKLWTHLLRLFVSGSRALFACFRRIPFKRIPLKSIPLKRISLKRVKGTRKIPVSLPEPAKKVPVVVAERKNPRRTKRRVVPIEEQFLPFEKENTVKAEASSEGSASGFSLPSVDFLAEPRGEGPDIDGEFLQSQSELLETKLKDFGIQGTVVKISPGPVITTFEYRPAPGVKISKIVNLSDDLALALSAISIRIVAPIPGKDVIGIEIPNADREMVRFREIVTSSSFTGGESSLTVCLGKDIIGTPVAVPMEKMPHLLVAGATGAGKSVGLNVMIASLLYKATPDQVKLLMVDPKRIELSVYDGIPHLICPVVTDMKKATNALFWAVREMERRYELLAETGFRNIGQYNKTARASGGDGEEAMESLPFIVIVIDEFADLMMVASRDVEVALTRLAQMARAAGIHIVLATQRPSVDVLTGVIKANFPTRISFQVSSRIDSRTIIDSNGAENLLGNGDMLYLPPGTAKLQRIHGAYISDGELNKVLAFLREQATPEYDEAITAAPEKETGAVDKEDYDEKYDEAVALVTKTRQASISSIQRHLRIGYNRAARIIEVMEQDGLVGPPDGAKPREILVKDYEEIP